MMTMTVSKPPAAPSVSSSLTGQAKQSRRAVALDGRIQCLSRHPLLEGIGDAGIADVLRHSVEQTFAPGEFLAREGELANFYWILCTGSARVFHTSADGCEVTANLIGAPAGYGELEVLHHRAYLQSCMAIEMVAALAMPLATFLRLLEEHPSFMKNVLLDTSGRFLIAAQQARALAFLSVPERLVHLLLSYARLYGEPVDDGVLLRTRLSQEQLANGLGVARKSVVRAFQQWTRAGIIQRRGHNYVVRDLQALAEQAPPDAVGVDWVAGRRL